MVEDLLLLEGPECLGNADLACLTCIMSSHISLLLIIAVALQTSLCFVCLSKNYDRRSSSSMSLFVVAYFGDGDENKVEGLAVIRMPSSARLQRWHSSGNVALAI